MSINKQLNPYYKRFFMAYFIKIGLLALSSTLVAIFVLLAFSKWLIIINLKNYIVTCIIFMMFFYVGFAWYKKPTLPFMRSEIDKLGLENRVVTYYDYEGKSNPFYKFLEEDLNNQLAHNQYYKDIRIRPSMKRLLLISVMLIATIGMAFWQSDTSLRGHALAESMASVDQEEKNLLRALDEEADLFQQSELIEEKVETQLEEIKEALANENKDLLEQEIFKLKEELVEAANENELPAGITEALESIETSALDEESETTMLSTLGQVSFPSVELSQSTEKTGDASSQNETGKKGDGGETNQNEDVSNQTNDGDSSEQSGESSSGDGT